MRVATTTSDEKSTATIIDVLRFRAETQKNDVAYRFLADGEEEKATLTYGELDRRARQIAAELQTISAAGQRALLLDSSELDYIVAFFGCLCAGVIAVPIYAPRLNGKGKGNARVESVVADTQPSVVLTAGPGSPAVRNLVAASAGEQVKWMDTNALPAHRGELWIPPALSGADIAFLQYTSGSTATPKGVMVSHANILHNEAMIQRAFGTGPGSSIVGWLPLYHDMGLIGNVLQPLYAGVPCILMSPVAFLQRPLRWLQAISRYQATTSGGPNFAYELCIRKIRPEDRNGLDLSSWRVAFNGAEPVRLETLNRFTAQFADCGFRREAFVPCYGLAEATLFVSGGLDANGVTTARHGANGGANNGAKTSRPGEKTLVACGRPPVEQTLRIVSPDSLQLCPADQVGEIWVKGPSVAQGYWRKAKESEETFNARILGTDEGPFLRTGDLGFLAGGQLFMTGRLKDLLIIRGQNYYPQDIELTVEQSDPILQPGCGAAFSLEIENEERLVVVQEAAVSKEGSDRDSDLDAILKLISRTIVANHELQAYAVVLIRKGTIPKTSSGKIQRHACRAAFLNKELHALREWYEGEPPARISTQPSNGKHNLPAPNELASWLGSEIARTKGIDLERVDLQQPFTAYGLDSLAAIEFAHKLQTEFEVEVEIADFFSDLSIAEIVGRATKGMRPHVSRRETEQPARYPLSYGQRALWFVNQMAPESAAYNISRAFRIRSSIDLESLRASFQALVDRHPSLRTTIIEAGGELVQQVEDNAEASFEYYDAASWSDAELQQKLVSQNQMPFRLSEGPLFRVHVYRLADRDYVVHVAVHHIVSDLWSLMLLFEQLGELYEQRQIGVDLQVSAADYSYADFVAWQQQQLTGPEGQRLWSYWKNELYGELAPLNLPTDHPRPPLQTFRGSSYPFVLNHTLCDKLKQLGATEQTTPFVTLLAAFEVMLHRLSGQKEIVVGCPTTGRPRAELAGVVGYFVNPVPLRATFERTQSFKEVLFQIRNKVVGALSHDLYPFALMVERLGIARDSSATPVFQTMFVFQKTYGNSEDFVRLAVEEPGAQLRFGGLQVEPVPVPEQAALFDLVLTAGEGPQGLSGAWQYNSDLFERRTIARWAEIFQALLEAIVSDPETLVSRLGILSESERTKLLEDFNQTELEYDRQRCVHQEIEHQTQLIRSKTAIAHRGRGLSYDELNAQANRMARYLRRMGVGKGDLVGIFMRRSPQMIVSMLGAWKAGAGYVPLDPQYPQERLQFMLQDAATTMVLTENSLRERVGETPSRILCVDEETEQIEKENPENLDEALSSGQVAYMIYTSGSTGVPKGVMLAHRNAMSFVAWAKSAFTKKEFDGVLAATSICFDLSVFELWATLSCGGTVVLADDLLDWWEHLDDEHPLYPTRLINTVPSAIAKLIQQGPLPESVRTVNLAGEALKESLVSQVYKAGNIKHVNNLYGPSETTTYSSWTTVRAEELVRIGHAVANTQLYVLDQEKELVPVGIVGELYIGGDGVAHGYWKRASLTAERFLPNPFSKNNGARMYRTGDMVRWHEDGQLEYLGRADQQVKLRGYRIELGEIEASLCQCESVREAVVVVKENGNDRRLVAYAVANAGMQMSVDEVRAHLQERLPQYMIPSQFVVLESLPKTPNGKVDRNALPEPQRGEIRGRASHGEVEEILVGIWAEVLLVEQVGVEENFFELGGHSLLATQVMSRIREVFQVELPLRAMFETPTIAGLARRLASSTSIETPPLQRCSRQHPLPLSFGQERLWFLSRYEFETGLYNVPVALRLRGALNIEAIKASLQEIVVRHEVLRTSFPEAGNSPIQSIEAETELAVAVVEIGEDELAQVLHLQARQPFDLSHGPLIRASLFRITSQDHVLLVVFHHIVCDGWSLGIMLRELGVLYDAFSRGAVSPLQPLPIQYADFSAWQREWLQGDLLERQLEYWKHQLADLEAVDLPTDRPYPGMPMLAGATEVSRLSQPLVGKLKSLSRQRDVTLFMTLLAGFKILLYRYTGRTDIACGSPVANRNRQEIEPLIGFFLNTLVLRTTLSADSSVAELLRQIREVSLQAYAHQDIPFERLVEALNPTRDLRRTPLFQTMFVLQNAPLPKLPWNGLEATPRILETGTAEFELTLAVREQEDGLELSLEYRTELFDAERMRRLLRHYEILLEEIVDGVERRIGEIGILSEIEKQQLLVEWNNTRIEYQRKKCLAELLEEQARRTPDAVAIVYEESQLTYANLNRRANQLANHLGDLGVGPEVRVGICVQRSLEMIIGLLGILKAGGAYVPLDPNYPLDRLKFMIDDAELKLLLTCGEAAEAVPKGVAHIVNFDVDGEQIAHQDDSNPPLTINPDNLAYVIYTSGSTGRPKGVAVSHGAVCNQLGWQIRAFQLSDSDAFLQKASVSFDASIGEIFAPLLAGARVIAARAGGERDLDYLVKLVGSQEVTCIDLPPSLLQALLLTPGIAAWTSLRLVISGGEALGPELVKSWPDKSSATLLNTYGPTEATVQSTFTGDLTGKETVPIGKPIANTQVYVLDHRCQQMPAGVPGELCIGGDGLARGYLNRPELTAEKFVPNPFAKTPGERLYRSGDRGRWWSDGNLEYLGRTDRQVKIRGYRVELEEIESALGRHAAVQQTAVIAGHDQEGSPRLIAYVVSQPETSVSASELRNHLKNKLPEHMVPGAFVFLEKMPRTASGKVDQKALPEPESQGGTKEGSAPALTPTEELIAGIWASLLGASNIGQEDNFFDLGGHSLLATQLSSRLKQVFHRELDLRSIFEFPILKDLSACVDRVINRVQPSTFQPIVPINGKGALPLSSQQERLWFVDRYSSSGVAYSLPGAVRLKGDLNKEAMRQSFQEIVRRHEILRARFVQVGAKPQLQICENARFELHELDLRDPISGMAAEERVNRELKEEAARPFVLSEGDLFRVRLLRIGDQEHILLVTIHHIVFDGWSVGVLVSELSALYDAYSKGNPSPLADLEIQYADYAVWQREMSETGRLTEGLEYWKQQLHDLPVLELPADHARAAVQSFRGTTEEWKLPAEVSAGLKTLSQEHGVTLFMALLAGFQILLARYSGQADITVGSPIANRAHPQLQALIGFFVNTLVLRGDLSGNPPVGEVLRRTRELCLAAYAHQTVPLEKLVDELEPHRDLSQNPLFQVAMVFENTAVRTMQLHGVEMTLLPSAAPGAKFDLSLVIEEGPQNLYGFIEYSTDLFERETISQMLRHYNQVLREMVHDPRHCVSTLPLLEQAERHQLLFDWNQTGAVVASRCIHELFEEQVERTPQAQAACHRGQWLTYEELNQRANQLGNYLQTLGVGPEVQAAICVERGLEMLVGIVGVLKAGGAYVPLNPRAASHRSDLLLEAVKPQVLITQPALLSQFPHYAGNVVLLDEQWDQISRQSSRNMNRAVPENLACVIYGSDLSGTPSGVAIQHSNAVAMLQWTQTAFPAEDLSGVLASSPVDSKESLFEMFAPLCSGGTVFVAEDPFDLTKIAEHDQVKLIQMAPSSMRELVRLKGVPESVRTINLGREAVPPGLAQKIYGESRIERVFSHYGHLEHTGYSTQALLPGRREDGAVPIGNPVMNTQVYVLDQHMEPVPIGVAGELYVAGAGLARGYVNQADSTASRFLPNPFSDAGGERLYRTGDLGRYRHDGQMDFLGGSGRQMRIRGRRIELGEIESVLQQQAEVDDAVVTVDATDARLVAYIIPAANVERGEAWEQKWRENLRTQLKRILPEYMVPSELVVLENIPICADGRLDREALPAIEAMPKSDDQAKLPLGETERIIADIWKQVLKIDEVGVEQNFFELGGNSLIIPEVHTALQDAFGVNLTVVELFQYPTIRSLAELLEAERTIPEKVAPVYPDEIVKTEQTRSSAREFAIVGMVCRLPGANNIEEFWHNLQAGVESIVDFSDEDLRAAGIGEELLSSPNYVKRGTVVANVDLFDARFFDISAREAELIDPQQRIFLECAWEALENAGYTAKSYSGKIGVYAGGGVGTYFLNLLTDDLSFKDTAPLLFANGNDFLATRVSYKLDLTGPSVTVQTACSTSLVAVHMACRALLTHECDIAMAGGIAIQTPQTVGDIFQEGGIVSPDGHCRTFDERAQGTVRGNGGGIVVIKRLEDALRDGDHIRAVIKGSAINNDGGSKVGYTAPSVTGQRDVIRLALLESGVSPETITYLEAHGTATSLGDPIEVSALTQAYRGAGAEKNAFCAIGSLKPNIGHVDAAAGIAGLIKTVLALEHKLIPPTLHFERPNPKIDFPHSPFYVNAKLKEWNTENAPRRAGVSSFGIGGTNAHVIVEEAPSDDSITACRPWQLVLLSTKTATALEVAAENLGAYLHEHDSVGLADVAHTLQVGRAAFAHRCFVVAESLADTTETLRGRHTKSLPSSVVSRAGCRVAFLFPGQGSQYVNMGKHLYAHEPLFRELVDECSERLRPNLQLDLRSVLYPSSKEYLWAETELRETRTTQPALFVVEYALAKMWMSWGLLPESMLGHSIGEYVAACLAGVFSLEDALHLVAVRGRLMHGCARGGMLAVAASEEEVQRCLKTGLELAAINGSRSCVLTGPLDSLALAEKELVQQQVAHRRLQSSHAFHSAMMEPIIGQFTGEVQKVRLNAPRTRYLSNLTGDWITAEQATDPAYWGKQLRGTVQFAQGLRNLCDGGERLTLEVGPGHTNSTAVRQTIAKPALPVMLTSLPDSHDGESDVKHVLTALGQLWLRGANIDWNAFASGEKRRRLPLPTYPFERQRFWVDAPASRRSRPDTSRRKLTDWLYLPSWKETARVASGSEAGVSANSTVLMFDGNSGMAEKLALKLQQKRYNIVTVVAGQEFAKVDDRTYTIDPAARGDYDALFSILREEGQFPAKIVHLWNVGQNKSLEQDLDFALYSPLHLVQAATAETGIEPVQCMIVSSGLHEITGNESLSPAKATLLGLCKTIPWELPDFACKSVDIDVPAEGSPTEHSLLDQLVAELESKEQQPVVSYRGARRWIQTFDPVHLEAGGPELVRERGVYLITGGLNDVGFQFAEWLASDAHASVVLVDGRPFPSREHWDTWPATHAGDPAVQQINRIRVWEQSGAKVLISNADVADQNQMYELRNQVQEVWGKIDGVIHAAGFSQRGPIASKTRNDIAAILAPKIEGALVLNEVLAGDDLDFMVFCSSLISVVGEAEQADYAAANAFLDSLARRNFFRNRCFTLSINWDAWDEPDGTSPSATGTALGGIRPEEAVEVLRRLLRAKPGPQAIISTRDLALMARLKKADTPQEEAGAAGRIYARPNLDRPIEPPTNATEALLIPIWTEVLGVSPIGIHDDFFELGGDSLIGLKMTARLRDLGVHVSIDQLFRHRTVQELAAAVAQGNLAVSSTSSSQSLGASRLQTTAIRRVDREGKLALSYGQQRLWFISQLEPENVAYNMPDAVRLKGPLDLESLERTLREIVRRHESLRTRFVSVNGEPQQIIDASIAVELPVTELSHLPEPEREAEARRLALKEAQQPFDLARGPLLRVQLLRLASQDHVLVFNMHHIVSDQWSIGVLVREVSAIYNNFSTGQPSPLPELDIQYADFSAWQRELLLEEQQEYWKRKLAAVEPLMLPTDRPRTPMQRQDGATMHFTVPMELTEALKTLSRKQGATLYMILLAAFQALLGRYSGQYDIAVGSPIAGRSRTETERLIGFFLNTLVLRTDLSGQPDAIELLRRVKETTLEAYAHQDVPFEKLVEVLLPQRDLTRTPLFQVMFVLQNVPWTALELGAAKMLPFSVTTGTAQFEISLVLAETGSGMEGFVEYNTGLFETATITRMIGHYSRLLRGMTSAPHAPIHQLDILSAEERQGLLEQFNPHKENIPSATLTVWFEAQARETPGATAVVFGEVSLSYAELNEYANRLAHFLIASGVGVGSMVGIALERSLEMVVAIVATLKAGGGYLPLDPEYPQPRLAYMMADAAPAVVLTTTALRDRLPQGEKVFCLDAAEITQAIQRTAKHNPAPALVPQHPAYVIYTSGSTGTPKGVVITHENVTRLFAATEHWFHFGPQDVWTMFHSYAFDFSVWEIWGALLYGGRLVLVPKTITRSPSEFLKLLAEQGVTVLNQTPSAFYQLMQAEQEMPEAGNRLTLRTVIFGGEALDLRRLREWYERYPDDAPVLVNMYGITETTVHVSYLPLTAELARNPGGSLIGGNIPDLRIYVLDEHLQPVPVGVAGEMYVAGAGLAQGYLNRPELTAERFVPDPLGAPGTRRYRTGDVARWRSDHTLEYLGRADQQVKIRGFRIELGEIEAALLEHEGVRQAAVTVEEENNAKRLVAYVVPRAGQVINAIDLKRHVRQKLPEAMVPATVVEIAELPLTANGKIDRKRLPKVEGVELRVAKNGLAPRSEIERYLAAVWQEFLQIDKVGAEDNFFDLGGHSLMIVQIQARLAGRFSDRIKVVDFFTYPTIAALAKYLERPQDDTALELAALERADRQLQAFAAVKGGRREAD